MSCLVFSGFLSSLFSSIDKSKRNVKLKCNFRKHAVILWTLTQKQNANTDWQITIVITLLKLIDKNTSTPKLHVLRYERKGVDAVLVNFPLLQLTSQRTNTLPVMMMIESDRSVISDIFYLKPIYLPSFCFNSPVNDILRFCTSYSFCV